jgi:hypothetical protein
MFEISDLPGWRDIAKPAWRWTLRAMRPQVIFGCPQQPLDARSNSRISWWHVPVMLKKAQLIRTNVVRRASVRLVSPDGGSGISLRWYSRDHRPHGVSVLDLDTGRIYLVPVVIRDEDGDGRAFITNEDWMLEKSDKHKWPLTYGRHDFWLQVWSGEHHWRSDYLYRITVPRSDISNGPFTMEVHYGNIY